MPSAAEERFAKQCLGKLQDKPLRFQLDYEPPASLAVAPIVGASRPYGPKPSAEAQAVNVRLTFKMMKSTAEPQHLAFNRLERIGTVRREVARAFNDHADSIRLLLGGKALANDLRTLLDYDVKEGASITVMKKAGGAGGVTAAESVAPNAFGKADDSETSKTVLTQNPEEEFKDAITKLSTKPAFWEGLEGYLQSQFSEKSHADKVYAKMRVAYMELLR